MKSTRKKQILSFFILLIIFFVVGISNVHAFSLVGELDCAKSGTTECDLDDFVQVAVNASKIILGVSGSLALLAFVLGGVMFLISSGSTERVTRGKQIITGAVIGLVIVFTSWLIIQYVMYNVLGYNVKDKSSWFILK